MQRLHYADGSFVTGDELATAVVRYARALARAGTADTVEVPILLDEGGFGRSQLLIGPASQLVLTPGDPDLPPLVDPVLVADIEARRVALAPAPVAEPRDVPASERVSLDFED
ncbi:hypothetical protein [Frigoribacterium salinisoli]